MPADRSRDSKRIPRLPRRSKWTRPHLPTRGLGITVGAHWYPLRMRRIPSASAPNTFRAGDGKTNTVAGEDPDVEIEGPTLTTRFTSLSPQLSLNFGRDEGWSYVSAGMGTARITTERPMPPLAGAADRTRALNYGGGARMVQQPPHGVHVRRPLLRDQPPPATAAVPGIRGRSSWSSVPAWPSGDARFSSRLAVRDSKRKQ